MLRTPDEEDLPLRHRPLPSVDIALLPHELRAQRMQKVAIGGGALAVIAVVLGLAYGPAVLARMRRSAEEKPAESEASASKLDPNEALPLDVRDPASGSKLAQTLPAMRSSAISNAASGVTQPGATTTMITNSLGVPILRTERKFGNAKSWRDALVFAGATSAEANEIIAALNKVVDFRRGKPDDLMIFERDSDKLLQTFEYRAGVTEVYRASRTETGALRGIKVVVPIETRRIAKGTYIAGTLGHSLSALGLGPQLAGSVIEAFDSRVQFTRDTRAGDSVKLIVNEEYVDGAFLRYGPVQAVEYSGERCGKLQAFWFDADESGESEFFDPSGRAVHGGWLRTPLRYDHISSPFNLKRRHPILKRIIPHLGIDYAAGTGTPVMAAADGVVTFTGPRGPNGNLVSLRHSNGFESHYAHLWKIAPGIKPGVRVSQRQNIGFVGSTGRSTGPHLHFALKRYGRFVDPGSQLNGPGNMMAASQLGRFRASIQKLRAELEQIPLAPAPSTEDLPKVEEPADDEDLDL